jgi:hypothetical protein
VNSTRLWILILTGVTFLAGLGTGIIVTERSHRETDVVSAFGDFERAFSQEFDLDPERQRLLGGLLDHYNLETQEIRDRYAAQNHREMEVDLRRAGLEYRQLTRDRLLPEHKRQEFDLLMASYVENL